EWNEYPPRARGQRDYFDDQWDRQHRQAFSQRERYGGRGYGGEARWPEHYEAESRYGGYYGEGGGDRRYEEAGGYTGGHRNAWNDSPRGGTRSGGEFGNGSEYGGGYGASNYGSRYAPRSSRYGSALGGYDPTGYRSPYDERHRSPGESFGSGSFGRPRGSFSGKGPKGYARSDERIREDVCERLTYDPDIDASNVTVTVANGEVTLAGEVENRHQKRLAEDLIEDVNGVHDVHNRLAARRGVLGSMMDEVTGRGKDENNVGKGPKTAS
ncbi:MAG TPA: BON domain-containing protein, partial [Polyangiaceae bacterium]|nr:BON domain-containing protein [Polyangiaceae bacterium]